MLRFEPDSWLEGLLRPFILADPFGFIYFESPAPDLRFAAIAILAGIVLVSRRMRQRLGVPAWRALVGFGLIFYLWTFFTGNGRYFMTGLLLAGPMLVLLVGSLPCTRPMRILMLAGLLGLQGMVIHQHFRHGIWASAYWSDGPGLPLGESRLRNEPAVFITVSSVSHSILVPQFHPHSRWANVSGQTDITPNRPEYAALRELLSTSLPRYVVLPVRTGIPEATAQPQGETQESIRELLARHGLQRDDRPCDALRSHLVLRNIVTTGAPTVPLGYWFCSLRDGEPAEPTLSPVAQAVADVFDAVEQRCPRFFPRGGRNIRVSDELVFSTYNVADTQIHVDGTNNVYFRHHRALNPTLIGNVQQVRSGDFEIPCDKLPGRYLYPWQRE